MNKPEAARLLDLLAALSHQTSFSVGCYCENEERCHRSILKKLLAERGCGVRDVGAGLVPALFDRKDRCEGGHEGRPYVMM